MYVSNLGSKFVPYDAKKNNCQDFLLGIMSGNNINDDSARGFIKQDVSTLFTKLSYRVAKATTDFSGRLNVAMTGKGVDKMKGV
jgi:hypothetical protein